MFKKTPVIFILMFSISFNSSAADLGGVTTLGKPTDVADAKTLNDALDSLSNRVTECANKKEIQPRECYCHYPKEISQLRESYEKALKLHPAWQDQVLEWEHSFLSLKGLRRQLETKCPTHPSSGTR